MAIELNKYEQVLSGVVKYFNPLKIEQLEQIIRRCFDGVSDEDIKKILTGYQLKGEILLSKDGWAITKGKYIQITGDTRLAGVNYESEIRLGGIDKYISKTGIDTKLVNCLWVMIDMLPDSLEFCTMSRPFEVTYIFHRKTIQLIYIPEEEEELIVEKLRGHSYKIYEETKQYVRRIAIMENAKHAFKIPEGLGFMYIVQLDHEADGHFNIVEERENIW